MKGYWKIFELEHIIQRVRRIMKPSAVGSLRIIASVKFVVVFVDDLNLAEALVLSNSGETFGLISFNFKQLHVAPRTILYCSNELFVS